MPRGRATSRSFAGSIGSFGRHRHGERAEQLAPVADLDRVRRPRGVVAVGRHRASGATASAGHGASGRSRVADAQPHGRRGAPVASASTLRHARQHVVGRVRLADPIAELREDLVRRRPSRRKRSGRRGGPPAVAATGTPPPARPRAAARTARPCRPTPTSKAGTATRRAAPPPRTPRPARAYCTVFAPRDRGPTEPVSEDRHGRRRRDRRPRSSRRGAPSTRRPGSRNPVSRSPVATPAKSVRANSTPAYAGATTAEHRICWRVSPVGRRHRSATATAARARQSSSPETASSMSSTGSDEASMPDRVREQIAPSSYASIGPAAPEAHDRHGQGRRAVPRTAHRHRRIGSVPSG